MAAAAPGGSILDYFEVLILVFRVLFLVDLLHVVNDLQWGHFAIGFVEGIVIDFKCISNGKERRFDRWVAVAPSSGGSNKVFFQCCCQGLKRDTRIDAHDFTLAGNGRKWRAMKEHFLNSSVRRERDYLRQYEYLVLTVSPEDSLPEARRLLVEHSEYGKWNWSAAFFMWVADAGFGSAGRSLRSGGPSSYAG
ncbi:hypothetical protein AHiyo6_25600 [Arthrobacter sp. Hiyo6]|nr:hypothetical protein AHiyo6_25600 [Arthrobacter sp. Hiyo6]